MTYPRPVMPRFPSQGLPPRLLPCPKVGRPASALTQKIWYYIHEYLLLPFSQWYMARYKIEAQSCILMLPFGLVLKRHGRVHEQEGLAMDLARAMGIPAPRFISFGSLGRARSGGLVCDSILMTHVPGYPLDCFDHDEVDWDVIAADLTRILTRMRSFSSPYGDAVCGVAGGDIRGPMMPASPLPRFANEGQFRERLRPFVVNRSKAALERPHDTPEQLIKTREAYRVSAETLEACFFGLPPHAIVFTHGDLNPQNIMIGPDGHVCAIIDWETAAWLPEYWEFSITALLPTLPWGKFMGTVLADGAYARETRGHQALFPYVADSFTY